MNLRIIFDAVRDDPVAGVLIVAIFMAAVAVLTKISIDNLKGRRDERP